MAWRGCGAVRDVCGVDGRRVDMGADGAHCNTGVRLCGRGVPRGWMTRRRAAGLLRELVVVWLQATARHLVVLRGAAAAACLSLRGRKL